MQMNQCVSVKRPLEWLSVCMGALALSAAALTAEAAGWNALMKDSALSDFSDEDKHEYLDVLQSFLDTPTPVAPVDWRNDRTGSGAHLELLGQPKIEGFDECRRVRTNVYSKKRKAPTRIWTACRGADGTWGLVSAK
jgi:surface antigen